MRLLIVSQYFRPESFRINEVAATLVGKGVEVEVLTGKKSVLSYLFKPFLRARSEAFTER